MNASVAPSMWHMVPGRREWHWISKMAAPCSVTQLHVALVWHHSEFARWQHPAMWHMALGWHDIEFSQTSAILEFNFRFRCWRYHCSRHVILHHSAKFLSKSALRRLKNYVVSIFKMANLSAILDFKGPIMGSLKSPCTTSYRSSIDHSSFWKICVFAFWRQTY